MRPDPAFYPGLFFGLALAFVIWVVLIGMLAS